MTYKKLYTIFACIFFAQWMLIYPMLYAESRHREWAGLPEARCREDMGDAMLWGGVAALIPIFGLAGAYLSTGFAEHGFQWTCRQGFYCGSENPKDVFCVNLE